MTGDLVAFLRTCLREIRNGIRAMLRALAGDPNPTMTPAEVWIALTGKQLPR